MDLEYIEHNYLLKPSSHFCSAVNNWIWVLCWIYECANLHVYWKLPSKQHIRMFPSNNKNWQFQNLFLFWVCVKVWNCLPYIPKWLLYCQIASFANKCKYTKPSTMRSPINSIAYYILRFFQISSLNLMWILLAS